jgi:hypothetical protein
MPLTDRFLGALFGSLVDQFGICWMFNCINGMSHLAQGRYTACADARWVPLETLFLGCEAAL